MAGRQGPGAGLSEIKTNTNSAQVSVLLTETRKNPYMWFGIVLDFFFINSILVWIYVLMASVTVVVVTIPNLIILIRFRILRPEMNQLIQRIELIWREFFLSPVHRSVVR